MQKVIVSIIGQDRPGIIAAVSQVLFNMDFNIENVSQTILQSQFSAIFIASTSASPTVELLEMRLKEKVKSMSLNIYAKALDRSQDYQRPVSEPFIITTKGPDRKGLVANITAVMAHHGVNVTNLQAIFKGGDDPTNNIMIYEVDIPIQTNHKELHNELQQRAAELGLDLSIIHKNIFEAINRI
jgi:glycine cleavage system transcriptional repressor